MTTLASRKNGLSVCWPVGTPSAPGGHGKYEIKSICVFFLHCLTICANIYPSLTDAPQPQLLLHWSLTSSSAKTKKHMLWLAHWLTTSPHILLLLSLQRCRSRLSCCSLLSFIAWLTLFPFSSTFSILNSFIPMSNACCNEDKEPWVELIDLKYYHNIFYYIHAFANKSLLSYV